MTDPRYETCGATNQFVDWAGGGGYNSSVLTVGKSSTNTETDTDLALGLGLSFGFIALFLCIGLCFYRQKKNRKGRLRKQQIAHEQAAKKMAERQVGVEQAATQKANRQIGVEQAATQRAEQDKARIQKQLTALQDSMKAMMEVRTPWKGNPVDPGGTTSVSIVTRELVDARAGAVVATGGVLSAAYTRWYWQEDDHSVSKHNKFMIKQPGNWVEYAGSVTQELEQHYGKWQAGADPGLCTDLTDRISSTGTEKKIHNAHSGTKYTVNVELMVQKNDMTGFARNMLREEVKAVEDSESGYMQGKVRFTRHTDNTTPLEVHAVPHPLDMCSWRTFLGVDDVPLRLTDLSHHFGLSLFLFCHTRTPARILILLLLPRPATHTHTHDRLSRLPF